MVSFFDIMYLTKDDLTVLNIEDLERLYGPIFHMDNWQTYVLYMQLRGDKMSEEEKQFYMNIIHELQTKEYTMIKNSLHKLEANEHHH